MTLIVPFDCSVADIMGVKLILLPLMAVCFEFNSRIERKIATISLESRDGPGRLGDGERGKKRKCHFK